MGSIKYFFGCLRDSFKDFKVNFGIYLPSYIGFLIVGLVSCIPWEGLGFSDKSFQEVLASISIGLASLILVTNVVLIEKSRIKNRERERLLYAAPTYLIYTLYSTLIILAFLAGAAFLPAYQKGIMQGATFAMLANVVTFSFFAIPAILAGICVAMVPLASVLIDNDSVNYFKLSFKMARKAPILVFLFATSSLFVETPSLVIDLLGQEWVSRLIAGILYSFVDAMIIIVLTKASVAIFYHLKKLTIGESVY